MIIPTRYRRGSLCHPISQGDIDTYRSEKAPYNDEPPYYISNHPEVLECFIPESYGEVIGGNKILLDSVLDGTLWFNAVCTKGYGLCSQSDPCLFGEIFRSRAEALQDAVAVFRRCLGDFNHFHQDTFKEKNLVERLRKWLDEVEADIPF